VEDSVSFRGQSGWNVYSLPMPNTASTPTPRTGVPTWPDFDALMTRAQISQCLQGEPLRGAVWRAGLPKTLVAPA
jgi:hypothetical protein